MAQLTCSLELANTRKSDGPALTVGEVFYIKCSGEFPKLQKDKLEFRTDAADKYKIVLLQSEFPSSTEGVFKATSYKVGHHNIKAPQLVDPENSVVLSDITLDVTSVINPQEKPEGPIAIGGLTLSIPMIYWLVLLAIAIAIGSLLGLNFYRRRLRKRLLDELSVHDSAQTPFQQFHSRLRRLQRGYVFLSGGESSQDELKKFVSEVSEAYRVFLARSYRVPALHWKDSLIVADLKRHHRGLFNKCGVEIKEILKELSRAIKASVQVSEKDCAQFVEITRKSVDHLEMLNKTGKGAAP